MKIVPVILCGGSGIRLWPLSRERYPKQFLPLVGRRTMVQETVCRLEGLGGLVAEPLVLCNEEYRFIAAEQLHEAGHRPSAIILEPVGRNTAPAVAVAALAAQCGGEDPLLLVLPADHAIQDNAAFCQAVNDALAVAESGRLLTFGICPTYPETGYGYIRAAATADGPGDVCGVERFVEKPDAETAKGYLAEGGYYWNSGMFLFRASRYLEELELHQPAILAACREALAGSTVDYDFTRLDAEAFGACPSDSIDYAVMEKTSQAAVKPLVAGWSDVGSWSALLDAGERDARGNVIRGDVLSIDSASSYLHSQSRLVAAIGLRDLVVVETADAVLVADKDRVQEVRRVVEQLRAEDRSEGVLHKRVNRPWGDYESIDFADRYQVKRITVKPGAALSMQLHHHRAEHWIVVRGTALVTCGDESRILSENQSTYIPVGVRHRLENPGKISLEIVEVQSGPYLDEDDIVRFDDRYGRKQKP